MCTRLFPDIIVAAEINNYAQSTKSLCSPIIISIDDCLCHQEAYKQFGICNVFVGYDDKEWNRHDYETYLGSFPDFFHQTKDGYEVNLSALARDTLCDSFSRHICNKLFTQGTYTPDVLKALGLLEK